MQSSVRFSNLTRLPIKFNPHYNATHMHTSDNLGLPTPTPNNALETPQDPFTLFRHFMFGREQ